MQILPPTRGCYVCGVENPLGLALGFATDERIVESRFRFRPEHCGFRDTVHGGLIATVLDEAMAWVIGVHAHRLAYCGELTTRFLRPVTTGIEVVARGELQENRRDRIYLAAASLVDGDGRVLAEATGKYLPVPSSLHNAMLGEFIADPSHWLESLAPKAGDGQRIAPPGH